VPVFVLAVLAGCGPKAGPGGRPVQHPLAGRIWSTADARWANEDALVRDLATAEFVLLGENHDDAEHHRLQARLITAIEPLAVGFEMLDHEDPLDAEDPAALAAAVGWEDTGWPPFALYAPVFEATFEVGARIVAAHPTRDEVERVMSGGFEALSAEATAGLALDRPLPEDERAELVAELSASHPVSAEVLEKLVRAQILKDAWMARALGMAARPAVLIAGGGHTRTDRGVPHYLDGEVRAVRFVVPVDGEVDPASYDEAADWLWFTGS
jgi:uncharacterized iron-regulated protein